VCVLQFSGRRSTLDERVFHVGIDHLIADGCFGIVCHVVQPAVRKRPLHHEKLADLARHLAFAMRHGLRVALVGGTALTERSVPFFVTFETEGEAIARLTEDFSSREAK
jgi:hypothetical protein